MYIVYLYSAQMRYRQVVGGIQMLGPTIDAPNQPSARLWQSNSKYLGVNKHTQVEEGTFIFYIPTSFLWPQPDFDQPPVLQEAEVATPLSHQLFLLNHLITKTNHIMSGRELSSRTLHLSQHLIIPTVTYRTTLISKTIKPPFE